MTAEKISGTEQGYIMMLIKAFLEQKPISRKDCDEGVATTLKRLYNRLNRDGTFRYKTND
jgi:hypothetical protein